MNSEVQAGRAFRLLSWWVVLGAVVGFVLWPRHIGYGMRYGTSLFTKEDFYYTLLSPLVIWWFFRVLVPSKEEELKKLGINGIRLLNCLLGLYVESVLRAALAAFFAIHMGVWG
jgi:hypothetical protein